MKYPTIAQLFIEHLRNLNHSRKKINPFKLILFIMQARWEVVVAVHVTAAQIPAAEPHIIEPYPAHHCPPEKVPSFTPRNSSRWQNIHNHHDGPQGTVKKRYMKP